MLDSSVEHKGTFRGLELEEDVPESFIEYMPETVSSDEQGLSNSEESCLLDSPSILGAGAC